MKDYQCPNQPACPRADPATTGLRQSRVLPPAHSFPSPSPGRARSASRLLVAVLLVGTLGLFDLRPAWAGDEDQELAFNDRFRVRGGYQYLFGADIGYRFDGAIKGVGTALDLNSLDADDTDQSIRVDALFRINPKHSIGFAWYQMELSGATSIDQDVQIGDIIIGANGFLGSKLDLTLYRLFYNYSFYHSQKAEVFGSAGMYVGDLDFVVDGSGTITPESGVPFVGTTRIKEDLFAPLPSVGFGINYLFSPKWSVQVRGDAFYVSISDIRGATAEFLVGVEYRWFKHFALGTSFNRVVIDVDYKPGKSEGFNMDASWNGLLVYGALYF